MPVPAEHELRTRNDRTNILGKRLVVIAPHSAKPTLFHAPPAATVHRALRAEQVIVVYRVHDRQLSLSSRSPDSARYPAELVCIDDVEPLLVNQFLKYV
jgi:hypothetical protein